MYLISSSMRYGGMDYMDIDSVEEVPDTPERFIASHNNDGHSTGKRSGGSSSCRVIDSDYFNDKMRNEQKEKGKSVAANGGRRLFARPDNVRHEGSSFVDLTEQNGRGVFGKIPPSKSFGVNGTVKLGPRPDRGKGVVIGGQHKAESNASSLDITPPRVNRNKRLVRNGCISPHNIAKSKLVAEKHDIERVENMSSDGPSTVDIKDLIAEAKGSRRFKEKGLSHHPSFLEEDTRSRHLPRRTVIEATDASKESEGWINTHNTTRKVDLSLADGDQHISRGKAASSSAFDQQNNGMLQRDRRNGNISSTFFNHYDDLEIDPTQRVSAPPDNMSRRTHNLGQFKERAQLTKRQRGGVALSNSRECAMPRSDDSERLFPSLSGEPSTSRSTRNKNRGGASTSDPVIAIDELYPEVGNRGSNTDSISNDDTSVRALQLEADEMLARELQEQLYNEELTNVFGNDEQDHSSRLGGRPAFRPASGGASLSNLYQHSRSSTSRNTSANRSVSRAQSPAPTRLGRLRGRFPGRSRRVSSTSIQSGPIFPSNMDMDVRMQILEALEAVDDMDFPNNFLGFNNMGLPSELLRSGRDFNENDYEMLLALDENNHRHGGATRAQINNLPESTVQAENLQECAICLETPAIGETIRHLPCLHRFHKDCIDEWLGMKTSCPADSAGLSYRPFES
ncbi:RING/U-box superfamily protein [Tanacetum coccineum]